jgi:hypothetical protein
MKKPGISSSGILSLLIGTALVGRVLYEKLIKKHKGDDKKHVINNRQDESTRNEIIKQSKVDGYTIFMNTVLEYLIEVDPQSQSFADFMRMKWASDYIIYIENEHNETKNKKISCKRSYKSWFAMYDAIKTNNLIDIVEIMKIGERDI